MSFRNAFFSGAVLLVGASAAQGAVTDVRVVQVDPGDIVPGFTTHDILIDFTNDPHGLGFQQMVLELTQGSIYQDEAGDNVAPSQTFVNLIPTLEFDTFVTVGGATSQTAEESLEVGGAVDIVPGSAKKFDTEGLSITWAPATGVNIPEGNDFLTARITLSDDAVGTLRYIGVGNSDGPSEWWRGETSIGRIVPPPPVAIDALIDNVLPGDLVNHVFMATADPTPVEELVWSNLIFSGAPGFGGDGNPGPNAPTLAADGTFNWNTLGAARGIYTATATVTDLSSLSAIATLTINVTIPEPSTIALLGLSVVGLVGLVRRRD